MPNDKKQSLGRTLIQSFIIAFSMYSKIPMPAVSWTEAGMKYALCFFPAVGAAVGGVMMLFFAVSDYLGIQPGSICFAALGTAIPILVTGGIHLDGFLDTVDARSSFQTRERKLEIMKDPHTGAFAVIGCGVYLLLYVAAFSRLDQTAFPSIVGIYVMTRAVSGWSVVSFPRAKKDGLASTFASGAQKKTVQIVLVCWLTAGFLYLGMTGGWIRALILLAVLLVSAYRYYRMAYREFGGMSGDLAGYFLQSAELWMIVFL